VTDGAEAAELPPGRDATGTAVRAGRAMGDATGAELAGDDAAGADAPGAPAEPEASRLGAAGRRPKGEGFHRWVMGAKVA